MNTSLIKVTRSILDLAYARGYLPEDPHGWFTKQREEKPDIDLFSFDEMVALLWAFSELQSARYYAVALRAIWAIYSERATAGLDRL
jgi:hypothetical protein